MPPDSSPGRSLEPAVPAGAYAGSPQPVLIIDEELRLRPWRPDDAAAVITAFTTADIQRWHARVIDDVDVAVAWIERANAAWSTETAASWAVEDVRSAAVAGRVSMYTDLPGGRGEVAYWTLPGSRGRGVATRACVAATRWAHDLGLHRVALEHSVENAGSAVVAERAGFVREGIRRAAVLHADGWHDMVSYSHLDSDPFPG